MTRILAQHADQCADSSSGQEADYDCDGARHSRDKLVSARGQFEPLKLFLIGSLRVGWTGGTLIDIACG